VKEDAKGLLDCINMHAYTKPYGSK